MVIKYFIASISILFFISCAHPSYKIEANKDGEPLLNPLLYTLNEKLTDEDFKIIDTLSFYIESFEGLDSNEDQRANPVIYKFHANGYFKQDSFLYYGKFDKVRTKNSAYYGGKYDINGNTIIFESFYPISGNNERKFSKVISRGVIEKDTIIIDFFGTTHKYIRKSYSEIFN